jgi:hypothetical protein
MTATAAGDTGLNTGADTSNWRKVVEPYSGADARRATFQLVTTLG